METKKWTWRSSPTALWRRVWSLDKEVEKSIPESLRQERRSVHNAAYRQYFVSLVIALLAFSLWQWLG